MQPHRRSACLLLLAGLVASACTEQTPPTAVPPPDGVNAVVIAAAGGNNQKVKVKTLQLSSNTLRIDGPSVSGTVSIGNSGSALTGGVVVKAEITQGAVSKLALNTLTQCSSTPGDPGKLPTGTCDMTFTTSASNAVPASGTLTPGSATFTLHVIQTSDAGDTELASKSLLVNLVAAPSMTVTIAPTTVVVDGAASLATAVVQNPANGLQGVRLQGWILQGAAPNQTRRPTGESLVTCGSNPGVLPPGTCTMTIPVSASNTGPGTGLLASGPATFELQLIQSSGSVNTTLDVKTVSIAVVDPKPARITGITLSPTLTFGGNPYTAFLQNSGPSLSTVVLQATLSQATATRAAGGRSVQCNGGPIGELPTGTCSVPAFVVAFNAPNAGTGTLLPGPATLEIELLQGSTSLDKKTIQVTLVMSGPTIIGIALSAPNVLIGEQLTYTATIYNPTIETYVSAGIDGYLSQGDIVDFGAGGTALTCAGVAVGTLPPGVCDVHFTLNTRNTEGAPDWSPGPATFRLELKHGSTLLDSRSLNVFLNIIQ